MWIEDLETSGSPGEFSGRAVGILRSGLQPLSPALAIPLQAAPRAVPLLLELLGELRLLKMFHSFLGIVAQLTKVVPHHSGHLVSTDLSPGTWAGNREIPEDPPPSLSLRSSPELQTGYSGGAQPLTPSTPALPSLKATGACNTGKAPEPGGRMLGRGQPSYEPHGRWAAFCVQPGDDRRLEPSSCLGSGFSILPALCSRWVLPESLFQRLLTSESHQGQGQDHSLQEHPGLLAGLEETRTALDPSWGHRRPRREALGQLTCAAVETDWISEPARHLNPQQAALPSSLPSVTPRWKVTHSQEASWTFVTQDNVAADGRPGLGQPSGEAVLYWCPTQYRREDGSYELLGERRPREPPSQGQMSQRPC